MNSLDTEVLQHALEWLREGHPVHLATVVQTWGSAPRQAGAMLAVRKDGRVVGSVSGGCIEDDLIARAQGGQLPSKPEWARYGVSQEEAARFGLPCGGTLRLVIEPLKLGDWIDRVVEVTQAQQLVGRWLDLATGVSTLTDARPGQLTEVKEEGCHFVYGPHWRLLIIGANQTAQALAKIATMLEFQVIVCDPREEFTADWDMPGVSLQTGMPDDAVLEIQTDARTAIVAITHDPKLDDMALLEALKSKAFYVGALGSSRNQTKRRQRLLDFDLTEDDIARLHGPVGLQIGSRTPAEIAVAVGAQLVQVRRKLEDERVAGLTHPPKTT
ncbi:XdhC family protein [Alcaligenaceae bacterium LF4-65]|jgi:xanthine dehydrogenase accessory factor|uniref:XdhC family protein n=1 Tax=Zwartia hollandica TaxID=324606 RepID=A0A953T6H6_9BURK|nr:XdhC family protein [Zwartia hollandica]MBZ1349819.1 XdhC family protein [Zwartia hollandica]